MPAQDKQDQTGLTFFFESVFPNGTSNGFLFKKKKMFLDFRRSDDRHSAAFVCFS